jgi:hypothetical protein
MAKGTLTVFDNREYAWKDEPLIAKGVQNIKDICQKIDIEAMLQQRNRTPGHTATRDQQRSTLENILFRISGRMKVYAEISADAVIASQVSMSRSAISSLSLNALLTTARTVDGLANGMGETLAEYKVTEAELQELRDAIASTSQSNAQRDAAQGERSENTSRLSALFAQLRKAFKLMDTQVKVYIIDEELLGAYFFTRRIRDVSGGSAAKKNDTTNANAAPAIDN